MLGTYSQGTSCHRKTRDRGEQSIDMQGEERAAANAWGDRYTGSKSQSDGN